MRLIAEPHIPFPLWLALALLAIAVMVWYAWTNSMAATRSRRNIILALMSATLALPLLVLLNLTLVQPVPPPAGKPVIRVLIDDSASMATADVDQKTRLSRAYEIAKQASDALDDQFEIRVSRFGANVTAWDIDNTSPPANPANETNLAAAISDSIKEDIPQGQSILLLSDGIHNVGSINEALESSKRAQAMDVPIFAATLGGDVGVKNVSVSLRSPQELAFISQSIPVVASVKSMGLRNQPLNVSLWQNGQKLEQQNISFDQDAANNSATAEVTFNLSQAQPGLYRYEIRTDNIADEATTSDNRSTLLLRVVDRPIKMLLVEGKPYWDTKFLVRRLAADQSVELTSIIRMSRDRYMQRHVSASRSAQIDGSATAVESTKIIRDVEQVLSPETLSELQIVILGRNADFFLTDDSLDALRSWISQDGGSLLCARGAPSVQVSRRLSQILPVSWSMGRENRFRVSMTPQGRDLRWLAAFGSQDVLGEMPSLATAATATQRPGLANVLAATINPNDGQIVPVLSYQPYGAGRTVVVEGSGMWRWALMSPEHEDREEVYATLWRSLLRWLVSRAGLTPGENFSLQPDRVSFDAGQNATATLLVRQDAVSQIPKIRLRSSNTANPNPISQEFLPRPVGQDPGVYRLDFGQLPPGQYVAESTIRNASGATLEAAFDVRQRWVEQLELDARPDLMARLAEESGGAVLAETDPSSLATQFKDHLARSRPPQYRRIAIWDRWWVMLALLGLWATTWVIRRKSGLI